MSGRHTGNTLKRTYKRCIVRIPALLRSGGNALAILQKPFRLGHALGLDVLRRSRSHVPLKEVAERADGNKAVLRNGIY